MTPSTAPVPSTKSDKPAKGKTERVLETLATVALVAGTIAAGAEAACAHCKKIRAAR